jgi:8-oxo-dGTP pyrophosphatase MutT (NUDIX family)
MFQVPIPSTGIAGAADVPDEPSCLVRMATSYLALQALSSPRDRVALEKAGTVLIDALAARISLGDVRPAQDGRRRAAVAVILHGEPATRVLLMKRVERDGDPWSGHISLPGGGFHVSDGDLRVTAIRETQEELGIDLTGARLLGNLAPLSPRSTGPTGIEVTPFVFTTSEALEPVCGPEALAGFWLPLELVTSGALDTTYTIPSTQLAFPSWTYEGYVVWGLTRRILELVLELAQPPVAAAR